MDHHAVHLWNQKYVGSQNVIQQAGYNTNETFQENHYNMIAAEKDNAAAFINNIFHIYLQKS